MTQKIISKWRCLPVIEISLFFLGAPGSHELLVRDIVACNFTLLYRERVASIKNHANSKEKC